MKTRLLLLLLFVSASALSQEAETLWCHELTKEKGLSSQDYNFYVYCDSENLTWISSIRGLNRFDGHQVKTYRIDREDSTALYGENIQSTFYEHTNQDFWLATYEAVHLYDRKKDEFSHYFVRDSNGVEITQDYYVFYLERDRFLWLRAAHGIYRVNVSDKNRLRSAFMESIPLYYTSHFYARVGTDQQGKVQRLFFTTNHDSSEERIECAELIGDHHLRKRKLPSHLIDSFSRRSIFQVYDNHEGVVWLSTDNGLIEWDLEASLIHSYPFCPGHYTFFTPYQEKYFIVSCYNQGLFLFDLEHKTYTPFTMRAIDAPNRIINKNVRNIYLDKNNILWITIRGGGIVFTDLNNQKFSFIPQDLSSKQYGRYLQFWNHAEDQVLVSHQYRMQLLDARGHALEVYRDSLLPTFKYVCKTDDRDTVLIATKDGVYWYNLQQKSFRKISGTVGVNFIYICQSRPNEWLASTLGKGVFRIRQRGGEWSAQKIETGTSDNIIYTAIYKDHSGRLYFCRDQVAIEILVYEGENLLIADTLNIGGAIYSFYESPDQPYLWIGTAQGLVKLDKKDFNVPPLLYTNKNGIKGNEIFHILPKNRNQLWLSTFKGLSLFDTQKAWAENYSLGDGVGSEQFRPAAGIQLDNGQIWFGGSNGITAITDTNTLKTHSPLSVIITDIKINDEQPDSLFCDKTGSTNINQIESIQCSYDENTLSFRFASCDYANPAAGKLKYMLEGEDDQWVNLNAPEGFVRYSNLWEGDYRLLIQTFRNRYDAQGPSYQKSIAISIHPPFWRTTLFLLFASISILFIIVLILVSRDRRIREKESFKTQIAENKMAALIAQMKPHFIFNSLQSINRFILLGNKKQASEYLGRFSGLIRKMLENSRNNEHTIEEEKDFLNTYLQVEKQRFKIPFDYKIHLSPNLTPDLLKIPTMMLQPFVENAIWHGLSHKDEQGKIDIYISLKNGLLECVIEDNGVGRIQAQEHSINKNKKHPSRALQIVENRLRLYFPNQTNSCSINFVDLKDDKGQARGTRASLILPAIY